MESIRGLGNITGDYVGDGQGDCVSLASVQNEADNSRDIIDEGTEEIEHDEVTNDSEPLIFLYYCETTGLSIYNDHITDIAAKVIASPVPLSNGSFSCLVKTSKHISATGMYD